MDNEGHPGARSSALRTVAGIVALLALFGYALFIHQGLGSAPGGWKQAWWQPSTFLLLTPLVGGWADTPALGTLYLTLPAIALTVLVFLGVRSAILRALAVSFVVMVILFCFTSFTASGAWELFHWRLSAVMVWIGLAIGFAALSPALAESWLRRGWVLRTLLYVPIFFGVVAAIRGSTGTDESLIANLSPWPAITAFGLRVGVYSVVGFLFGLAIGVGALSRWQKRPMLAVLGVVVGAVFPALWAYERFTNLAGRQLVGIAILGLVLVGLFGLTRGGARPSRLARRAAYFALGASLVIAPLFAGRAWADGDFTVNKFVRARIITDALATYYAREGGYPDHLSQLVEEGDLARIPRPRVGFDVLYELGLLPPVEFTYRNLGSSYWLEFSAIAWVQCQYSPPWSSSDEYTDDDDDEGASANAEADEGTNEGSWTCPDRPPELWGNSQQPDSDRDADADRDGDE